MPEQAILHPTSTNRSGTALATCSVAALTKPAEPFRSVTGCTRGRSTDAPHKRVVLDGAALNVDALVALGRSLMPAKKASAAAAKHENPPGQAATIEQIRSAVEFLSGYLDEHPEVLADEPDWMNNIARPFAHQAWRCPDQREELERLLDELSQKAPGYDRGRKRSRGLSAMSPRRRSATVELA